MSQSAPPPVRALDQDVSINAGRVMLQGTLWLPPDPIGMVIFAHGSGSSRLSIRNRRVAQALVHAGFGTLLFDLLTEAEESDDAITGHLRFDIGFLTDRLLRATSWVQVQPETRRLPIGYFGASTGAAAALAAAAQAPKAIRAVVSRGGRPDLAEEYLPQVWAPTLLIVGGRDDVVIGLNDYALARIPGAKRLKIVPGATHLFQEAGTLEAVAQLAIDWFAQHLKPAAAGN